MKRWKLRAVSRDREYIFSISPHRESDLRQPVIRQTTPMYFHPIRIHRAFP